VGGGADEEVHVVFGAQQGVEVLQVAVCFLESAALEEVVLLAEEEDGLGSLADHHVHHFKASADDAPWALFGIGGEFVFKVGEESGDVAAGGGESQAVVVGPDPLGECAAAGVSCDADALGIHFGACEEVVNGDAAVPDAPAGHGFAQEFQLLAHDVVCGAESRALSEVFFAGVLVAFALVDGVEHQGDEAVSDQSDAEGLVGVAGLAFLSVAAGGQYGGGGSLQIVGNIEVRGDAVAGAAVERHLFKGVAVAGQLARGLGVEGALGGEGTKAFRHDAADPLLEFQGLFLRAEIAHLQFADAAHHAESVHEVINHHVAITISHCCVPFSKMIISPRWTRGHRKKTTGQNLTRIPQLSTPLAV